MTASATVARNLANYRADRGLSMSQLARESGVSKQTISALEAGRGNPTVDTLEVLADTLGVSVRALVSETGSEVLVHRGAHITWETSGSVRIRPLDQAFGSGYVFNTVVRLQAGSAPSRHKPASRGALRHCYVLEGTVRLGPEVAPVVVTASDFVRFPADGAHFFESVSPESLVYVCTTAPQLSMGSVGRAF